MRWRVNTDQFVELHAKPKAHNWCKKKIKYLVRRLHHNRLNYHRADYRLGYHIILPYPVAVQATNSVGLAMTG